MKKEKQTTSHYIRSQDHYDPEHPTFVKEHFENRPVGKDKKEIKKVFYPARWQKGRGK